MQLNKPTADICVPDQAPLEQALARTTHLAIGAHQDDLEIFAYHGIAECFGQPDQWFTGVTVTNGAGSSRTGIYADYSNEQMVDVRRLEQRKAAIIGEYSSQFQLDYPSSEVKGGASEAVVGDLKAILEASRPEVVYLHQPLDKHDTHVAVLNQCLVALRELPAEQRPRAVYGCEVWRDLDWLPDDLKVVLPVSKYPNLAAALLGVFDSQITGGKRYDLAAIGRRLANATFFESHAGDTETGLSWAIDLLPVIEDESLSLEAYASRLIEHFREDVVARVRKHGEPNFAQ